jgi:hypothetical protein
MQIHISWKTIIATLIFAFGIVLLIRLTLNFLNPPPQTAAQPQAITTVPPTPTGAPIGAATASSEPEPGAEVTAVLPTPTPSIQPTATATLAPELPSPTPEPTPEPTLPPPTPTPEPLPTRVPTPVPAQLRLIDQGFGQDETQMSYAFIVTNPNPELLAQAVRYQVAAYDANGVVLATDTDTIAQIGPGQNAGVAEVLTLAPNLVVARIEVLLRPGQFVRSPPLQTLTVTNGAFVVGDPPNATGLIQNSFDRDLIDVTVIGIVYDDAGIIGGGSNVVPFIPAQGQAPVSVPVATNLIGTRVAFWVNLVTAPTTP